MSLGLSAPLESLRRNLLSLYEPSPQSYGRRSPDRCSHNQALGDSFVDNPHLPDWHGAQRAFSVKRCYLLIYESPWDWTIDHRRNPRDYGRRRGSYRHRIVRPGIHSLVG